MGEVQIVGEDCRRRVVLGRRVDALVPMPVLNNQQVATTRTAEWPPSLAEQPVDVLSLVGASLADALEPTDLTALASSCWAVRHALEAEVAQLKEERQELMPVLRKLGPSDSVEMDVVNSLVVRAWQAAMHNCIGTSPASTRMSLG